MQCKHEGNDLNHVEKKVLPINKDENKDNPDVEKGTFRKRSGRLSKKYSLRHEEGKSKTKEDDMKIINTFDVPKDACIQDCYVDGYHDQASSEVTVLRNKNEEEGSSSYESKNNERKEINLCSSEEDATVDEIKDEKNGEDVENNENDQENSDLDDVNLNTEKVLNGRSTNEILENRFTPEEETYKLNEQDDPFNCNLENEKKKSEVEVNKKQEITTINKKPVVEDIVLKTDKLTHVERVDDSLSMVLNPSKNENDSKNEYGGMLENDQISDVVSVDQNDFLELLKEKDINNENVKGNNIDPEILLKENNKEEMKFEYIIKQENYKLNENKDTNNLTADHNEYDTLDTSNTEKAPVRHKDVQDQRKDYHNEYDTLDTSNTEKAPVRHKDVQDQRKDYKPNENLKLTQVITHDQNEYVDATTKKCIQDESRSQKEKCNKIKENINVINIVSDDLVAFVSEPKSCSVSKDRNQINKIAKEYKKKDDIENIIRIDSSYDEFSSNDSSTAVIKSENEITSEIKQKNELKEKNEDDRRTDPTNQDNVIVPTNRRNRKINPDVEKFLNKNKKLNKESDEVRDEREKNIRDLCRNCCEHASDGVFCEKCERWYHFKCAYTTKEEVLKMGEKSFNCSKCNDDEHTKKVEEELIQNQDDLKQKEKNISDLKKTIENYKVDIKAEKKEKEKVINEKKKQISTLTIRLEASEKTLHKKNMELDTSNERVKTLQATVKSHEATVELQAKTIHDQEIKISTHKNMATSFIDELLDSEGIDESEQVKNEHIAVMYKQLESKDQEIQKLRNEKINLLELNADLKKTVDMIASKDSKEKKAQVDDKESKDMKEKDKEIKELKVYVKKMEETVSESKQELKKVKNALDITKANMERLSQVNAALTNSTRKRTTNIEKKL